MGKELPAISRGIIDKYLSWDRNAGEPSQVAVQAFNIYKKRVAEGRPGNADEDWHEAEEIVGQKFAQEVLGNYS